MINIEVNDIYNLDEKELRGLAAMLIVIADNKELKINLINEDEKIDLKPVIAAKESKPKLKRAKKQLTVSDVEEAPPPPSVQPQDSPPEILEESLDIFNEFLIEVSKAVDSKKLTHLQLIAAIKSHGLEVVKDLMGNEYLIPLIKSQLEL